jgi:hypothetical protein
MNTVEHSAPADHSAPERPLLERKEPTYVFTEKQVAEKSEIARYGADFFWND